LVPNRDALIELAQLGRAQQRLEIQLADEDDLQQLLFVRFEVREDANLLEHRHRQVLRLVDDEHGARLQRHEAQQEVVERVDQLLFARRRQASVARVLARDDAEVLQDALEELLFGEKRIQHERRERRPIDLFEQRAAQRRLPRADVAGDGDEPFAAPNRVLQQIERVRVRLAPVQILRVRRQTERLLREPVVALVHDYWALTPTMTRGVSRMTSSTRLCVTTVPRPNQPPLRPTFFFSRISRSRVKPPRTSVSPSATRASMSASSVIGAVTIGVSASMIAPSPPACGVTLTVTASVFTIAGSLFTASSDGFASTVVFPCAASRSSSFGRSVVRSPVSARRVSRAGAVGVPRNCAPTLRQSMPDAFSSFSSTSITCASI